MTPRQASLFFWGFIVTVSALLIVLSPWILAPGKCFTSCGG